MCRCCCLRDDDDDVDDDDTDEDEDDGDNGDGDGNGGFASATPVVFTPSTASSLARMSASLGGKPASCASKQHHTSYTYTKAYARVCVCCGRVSVHLCARAIRGLHTGSLLPRVRPCSAATTDTVRGDNSRERRAGAAARHVVAALPLIACARWADQDPKKQTARVERGG